LDLFSSQTSWSSYGRSPALFRGIQCHPESKSTRHTSQEINPVQLQGFKGKKKKKKNHIAVQNSSDQKMFSSFNKKDLNISGQNQEVTSRK